MSSRGAPRPRTPGCSRLRQRPEFAGQPIASKHDRVLRRHGPIDGRHDPRSPSCRLARRSGHLIAAGTRAAPFRPLQAPDQPSGWLPLAQVKQGRGGCLWAKRVIHLTQAAEDQHWGTRTGPSARVEPRAGTDARAAAHPVPTRSPQPLPLNLIQMDSPWAKCRLSPPRGGGPHRGLMRFWRRLDGWSASTSRWMMVGSSTF